MTKPHIAALCLLALCAGPAQAGPAGLLDGTYDAFDCAPAVSDQRITLSGNTLAFYESSCTLSNPQALRNFKGAVLLDADCAGEGESWSIRFILMQTTDGGLSMMQEGWGDHYARCD